MIGIRTAKIVEIVGAEQGVTEIAVRIRDHYAVAVSYDSLTGELRVGDEVLLNTTAVDLGLGTGGRHFVMANLSRRECRLSGVGHIIKLRYTPLQLCVLAAEEPQSADHDAVRRFETLDGLPVVCISLHSMLAPVAAAYRQLRPDDRVVYVMTDAAALPLGFSKLASNLRQRGMISSATTAGHAFGGDHETVGVPGALAHAHAALQADMVIVGMGPGNVGTGTPWGTTALELGSLVNTAHALGGRPIAALRVSFADPRKRHHGVSHHSLTSLGTLALARAEVGVPELPPRQAKLIQRQLARAGIDERHRVRAVPSEPLERALDEVEDILCSMGRFRNDDPAFFLAAAAAGYLAGVHP